MTDLEQEKVITAGLQRVVSAQEKQLHRQSIEIDVLRILCNTKDKRIIQLENLLVDIKKELDTISLYIPYHIQSFIEPEVHVRDMVKNLTKRIEKAKVV